jgi:hypothetical protein
MNGQIELSSHLLSYSKKKLEVQFKLKNNSENVLFINECLSANLTIDSKIVFSIFYKLETDTNYESLPYSGEGFDFSFDDFSKKCFMPLAKNDEFSLKTNLRSDFNFDVIDSLLNKGEALYLKVYLVVYYKTSLNSEIMKRQFLKDFLYLNTNECSFEIIN